MFKDTISLACIYHIIQLCLPISGDANKKEDANTVEICPNIFSIFSKPKTSTVITGNIEAQLPINNTKANRGK